MWTFIMSAGRAAPTDIAIKIPPWTAAIVAATSRAPASHLRQNLTSRVTHETFFLSHIGSIESRALTGLSYEVRDPKKSSAMTEGSLLRHLNATERAFHSKTVRLLCLRWCPQRIVCRHRSS